MRGTVGLALAFVALIGLTACRSRFACEKKSKCSADPAQPAWSIAECKVKMVEAKCGALYAAWRQCQWDHSTCDSHARTDVAVSTEACTVDGQAYLRCEGIIDEARSATPPPALPSGHLPLPTMR